MRSAGLLLAALALCAACASAPRRPQARSVEAEGWAVLAGADQASARRQALSEAQKRAVEIVAGVLLSARTRIDGSLAVRQRLLADVRGVLRGFDILGERREDGFLKVRIRARVEWPGQGEDPPQGRDPFPPEPPPGNPRFLVTLAPQAGLPGAWREQAAEALRRGLRESGLSLVEAGSRAQADWIVEARVGSRPLRDPHLGPWRSCTARVALRVVSPAGGEVLYEEAQEAPGLGPDADSAAAQSLESAGLLAGAKLAREISDILWAR